LFPVSDAPLEQKDLRAYVAPVLKRWWLIVAIVPIVTVATYLYYDHKPKTYSATAELYVQPSTLSQLVFGSRAERETRTENYALLLQTAAVGERARKRLEAEAKKGKGKVPSGAIGAQGIEKTSFLIVEATASTPQGAARLANAYAFAFAGMQRHQVRAEADAAEKRAKQQLKQLGHSEETLRRREAIESQIQQLQLIAQPPKGAGGIRVVEPASAVPVAHGPDPVRNAVFAALLGLLAAIAAAYGLEYTSRRITKVEDAEEAYELPVLTEVPQVRSPAPSGSGGVLLPEPLRGPFQRLQTNLEILSRERPVRTILVASAAPDEGKSIVARNLALAYREAGRNVAVLDADFRRPSQDSLLAVSDGLGLSDILAGQASFGQVVQEVAVQGANGNGNGSAAGLAGAAMAPTFGGELAMVAAGRHQGLAAALSSQQMSQTLRAAVDVYGTAIIDSPPLLAVPDVLPLLAEADAVVLVTRLGVSTRDSARRLIAELRRMPDVRIAGLVVNGIPRRVFRARSYDSYSYRA
jgi:polysaccharide biosynthesis transport protein